jgi:hypothetical protein
MLLKATCHSVGRQSYPVITCKTRSCSENKRMGNSHDSRHASPSSSARSQDDEYLSYLSKEENQALIHTFKSLSTLRRNELSAGKDDRGDSSMQAEAKISENYSRDIFHMSHSTIFLEIMRKVGLFDDLKIFRKYIVKFSLSTSSIVLTTLWELLSTKSSPKMSPREVLQTMLLIAHDMAYDNTLDQEDTDSSVHQLTTFMNSYHERLLVSSSVRESDMSLEDLIAWSQDYAPNFHKVFETYFHRICWRDEMSPSFIPYCRPLFMDSSSSIVNEVDLFPLSLYSDRLQGVWKKLYTTETDGMSFNRIAHHILGYDVSVFTRPCYALIYELCLQFRVLPVSSSRCEGSDES